ncbi:MAG: cytochrome c peroxidase [Dyadobacter sp.]|uniref:cytochrome-c peroxidase n=1 Tax=Dyadobacter sp. TaxID=1914288 RepID=UPI00326798D5
MKKFLRIVLALICVLLLNYCQPKKSPKDQLYSQFNQDLDSLILMNEELLGLAKSRQKEEVLREKFISIRLQYKKTEAFAEYFFPTTIRLVNGAPLDEIEDEENAVFEPGGFQVIEELIYTEEPIDEEELIRHIRKTQVNMKRIQTLWKDIQLTDSQILDALRLEMFRLITLGISGFDTPASGNAIAESRVVIGSFQHYIDAYKDILPQYEKLTKLTNATVSFLKNSKSFNEFNRAVFIADYINPLCLNLHDNQKLAGISFIRDHRLLRGDAATLFDKSAFDPEALLSNTKFSSTADRIALGEKLFYDPRVSGNGKTSCGSCHQAQLAFTDGLKTSKGFDDENLKRNAPTIMYAALQQALFYDLRSPSLEDQAADVIHNKAEMHGSMDDIARLIGSDSDYKKRFSKAYPELDYIQPVYIQNSIAAFVRSLNPFNSPFDKYMRGYKKALTDNQVNGFNLFMGKAKCGTCHFVPLFNGTVPPDYQRTESEVLGVTANADLKHPLLDHDPGRGVHNQFPQWKNAFKTITIRNIAKTAPYMHNGAFSTLEEVMEFYNEGGGAGLGLEVPNQTLAADKLNLSPKEIALVIEFMQALTD